MCGGRWQKVEGGDKLLRRELIVRE